MKSRERLVYIVSTSGHRKSYADTLSKLFELDPLSGPMNRHAFRRLLAADSVLIATLDDHLLSFTALAVLRSLLHRPTAALFLRAQKCFETGRWYYSVKRSIFRALRRLPHLSVASITPFEFAPQHAQVAHLGVFDPQYWDLHDGSKVRRPPNSSLAQAILASADGRPVLCAIGVLNESKGLEFLAETLERNPNIAKNILVVGAGKVAREAKHLGDRLKNSGAIILDRYITESELESLYGVADAIWACYSPEYDQASGVFGRAAQLGITSIVRKGSTISRLADEAGISHIDVPYGDHCRLGYLLTDRSEWPASPDPLELNKIETVVGGWRTNFIELIGGRLRKRK